MAFFAQKTTWLGVLGLIGSFFDIPVEAGDLIAQALSAMGGALIAWGNGK